MRTPSGPASHFAIAQASDQNHTTKPGALATLGSSLTSKGSSARLIAPLTLLCALLALALPSAAAAAAPTVTVEDATEVSYVSAHAAGTVEVTNEDPAFNASCRFDYVTDQAFQPVNEQQKLTVKATGGTFALSFGGQSTTPLAFNAPASAVETALNALSTVGGAGGTIAVSGGPGDANGTTPYTLAFGGSLAATNVEAVSADGSALTPNGASTQNGASAKVATIVNGRQGGFNAAPSVPCEPQTVEGTSPQPVAVKADLHGLAPATTYHLRLVASNLDGEATQTAADTFTTKAVAKPIVALEAPSAITPFGAHFKGTVNPNAPEAAPTGAAVEEAFKTTYSFSCNPACPGLSAASLAADNSPHEVSADPAGLIPGLHYEATLSGENAGGKASANVFFTTEALPPSVDATFAIAGGETTATLGAKVNPGGAETTVYFQYLSKQQYEEDGEAFGAGTVETEPEPLGSRFATKVNCTEEEETKQGCIADARASQPISGLTPATAYRFRAIASNEKSPAGGNIGPTSGFRTSSTAPVFAGQCPANEALRQQNRSTALPDCRAYEMVSPLDKNGFPAYPPGALPAQAAPSGEKLEYQSYSSFPGAEGNTALWSAHLSSRTASGWQTVDWTPKLPLAHVLKLFLVGYDFSEDLTQAVVKVPLTALTPGSTPFAYNLFLHHPGGEYSLVNAALPTVSVEEQCPPSLLALCFFFIDVPAYAGGTPDFSHMLFESNAQLKPEAPETGIESLYESSGGEVRLVGFLPDGSPAGSSTAGAGSSSGYVSSEAEADRRVENTISADGSKVIFSAPSDGVEANEAGQGGMTEVYDRIGGSETIELSAPNAGATPENPAAAPATFWAASKDGSRGFFTSCAQLTSDSTADPSGGCSDETGALAGNNDLYEYDFERPEGQRLTDLTATADPAGARVMGVVNSSADGSYVYFVAKGQLDGAKGSDGKPNLYMSHEGEAPVFVATLSETGECKFTVGAIADACDWTPFGAALTADLTPDGRHLAFMSTESLPSANFPEGYENTDQRTGEADAEVYEYTAPGGGGEEGKLVCGSCAPSGAQPFGNALIGGLSPNESRRLDGEETYTPIGSPFIHTHAMSENGSRLFYTAPDANRVFRVSEYERSGEGSCGEAGGCQYEISSPESERGDRFLGVAHEGRDVFIATGSRLVPGDVDNLMDVYDAREGGGFAPALVPVPCEGEGCRGPASARPPASSTASSGFAGPEEGPKHLRCAKGQVKRHSRCVAKKSKGAKQRKSKKHANANRRAGK